MAVGNRGAISNEPDRARRISEVAKVFDTSERNIWRLIKRRELNAVRIGMRCVRVFDSELARYRDSLRNQIAV